MLRACRRVLRPGGRTAFTTIEPAPDLTGGERRRAHRAGPPFVAVRTSYEGLLASAGFDDIAAADVTDEYRATQQRWIEAMDDLEPSLRRAVGDDLYDERATMRARTLRAVEAGLLVRTVYTATAPVARRRAHTER